MKKHFYLREELAQAWQERDVFKLLSTLPGEVYRDKEGRRTLRFELDGRCYFLKYHAGVGWGEIVKNLLQLRKPIISAKNEWRAIKRLHQLGVDTMTLAGYGERGLNPARRESFVITDELTETMSLEHVGLQWQQRKPTFRTKQTLIRRLAAMSRKMHQAGINHRDYYLCHILLTEAFAETNQITEDTELFLIDLHRTQIRRRVPERWLVKDLGSLYFSAHEVQLSQRDKYRFIKNYSGLSLRQALTEQTSFWQKVEVRAQGLLEKWHRHNPS
ncbi:lipopolysaccharide core heptose(I) kinase RfaP [Methylophaga sp.]|uniref:lipopolysaccharide core heptose(I) kinase RfaP n=1 Tax=Methylophaga sp. TaxID=2024840 RepID=UPI0014004900|nr:lipopolysaccharide core heptose(I) kinase RfaP [Methylophaga sp.]MTI63685.1 lipopolysaccharide core heptose(I) kinase RfaP [Methylophaga sp.]